MRITTFLCMTILLLGASLNTIAIPSEPIVEPEDDVISISDRRELLIDYFLIDELNNARLQLHRPRRVGVALEFDKPWEGRFSAYPTILNDKEVYRMY